MFKPGATRSLRSRLPLAVIFRAFGAYNDDSIVAFNASYDRSETRLPFT